MKIFASFLLLIFFTLPTHAQHFVLVGGLNNEKIDTYFDSLESLLKSRGVKLISKVMPSSLNTVMENTSPLRRQLLALYQSQQEPLFIIAHSKGGLEVANTLARYAHDFPATVVQTVIYSNTPFLGSPYMAQSVREFKTNWGWGGNQYNPVYLNALAVLESLLLEKIELDLQNSHLSLSAEQMSDLSRRTFYLRTAKDARQVSSVLKKSAAFLRDSGANDGLIPARNQMRKGFGTDLKLQNGIDHTDLYVSLWGPDSLQAKTFARVLSQILN